MEKEEIFLEDNKTLSIYSCYEKLHNDDMSWNLKFKESIVVINNK